MALLKIECGKSRLGLLAFGLQGAYALPDEHRIDSRLDSSDLACDALVKVGKASDGSLSLLDALVVEGWGECGVLGAEVRDGVRPEDVGLEKMVDLVGEAVLADVLPPFCVRLTCMSGLVFVIV